VFDYECESPLKPRWGSGTGRARAAAAKLRISVTFIVSLVCMLILKRSELDVVRK
jgi:hypothetical protein